LYPNERGESKFSAKEVTQAYIDYGNYIFKRQFFYPFWGAKYTNKYLEQMLEEFFHEDTLENLRKPCLLTSYDITQRTAVFFNSVSGRSEEQKNYQLKDAILASTAAPTYFPPTCKKERKACYGCLVDGGVVANNPALCALIEALKLPDCNRLSQIMTISVGNAKNTKSYAYKNAKLWGLFQWALPMFDILMDGSAQTVDYQLRRLYKSINQPQDYFRFLLHTDENIPKMDDCSSEAIHRFIDFGARLADREKLQLENLAKRLTHYI
jgi:patatin-like phospholipase/acyl hydrolase